MQVSLSGRGPLGHSRSPLTEGGEHGPVQCATNATVTALCRLDKALFGHDYRVFGNLAKRHVDAGSETGMPVTFASLAVPPLNCSVFCAPSG